MRRLGMLMVGVACLLGGFVVGGVTADSARAQAKLTEERSSVAIPRAWGKVVATSSPGFLVMEAPDGTIRRVNTIVQGSISAYVFPRD
jgi:hypothetical protein